MRPSGLSRGCTLANRRFSARQIREVLRLRFAAALSGRAIARSLHVSPSTVEGYVRRAEVAGLGWPVPESVDDAALERRLFPPPPPSGTSRTGLKKKFPQVDLIRTDASGEH